MVSKITLHTRTGPPEQFKHYVNKWNCGNSLVLLAIKILQKVRVDIPGAELKIEGIVFDTTELELELGEPARTHRNLKIAMKYLQMFAAKHNSVHIK